MNNKALIGKLIFLIAAVILIIVATIYFTGHFGFRSGKVSLEINYDESISNAEEVITVGVPKKPQTNESNETEILMQNPSQNNLSLNPITKNGSLNYTNVSR